ncbi:radical SAM protein [bacterium]|nr:radical SAM protein [bacterium]
MGLKHRWEFEESARRLCSTETREIDLSASGQLNIALIFLGPYALGMSNLGFLTVHKSMSLFPGIGVERFFFPLEDGIPFPPPYYSFETHRPLGDFHILAFSLSFEDSFDKFPALFSALGIPINAEKRKSRLPLLLAGGAAVASNPRALSRVFDILVTGEAEPILFEMLSRFMKNGLSPDLVADLPGVWVPSQTFSPNPIVKVHDVSSDPAFSHIVSSQNIFGGAALIEVMRGCPRACSFCLARKIYFPPRAVSMLKLMEHFENHPQFSEWGLVAPSLFDHPEITSILEFLAQQKIRLRNSSAKWEKLTVKNLELLRACGVTGLTLAPETGSIRLGKEMGKVLQHEFFFDTLEKIVFQGFSSIKLYFMLGVPSETFEDLDETLSLIEKVKDIEKGRLASLVVSFSGFVPKWGTPWQDAPAPELSELKRRFRYVKNYLQKFAGNLRARFESPKDIVRQAYLAKVGPEFAEELEKEAFEWNAKNQLKKTPPMEADF